MSKLLESTAAEVAAARGELERKQRKDGSSEQPVLLAFLIYFGFMHPEYP